MSKIRLINTGKRVARGRKLKTWWRDENGMDRCWGKSIQSHASVGSVYEFDGSIDAEGVCTITPQSGEFVEQHEDSQQFIARHRAALGIQAKWKAEKKAGESPMIARIISDLKYLTENMTRVERAALIHYISEQGR